ncbi:glucosylceramidase [Mobilisporobacter senegalensis]|uniref:Glucosylceramidase n=1 Tax=Mobilisporobacter senegalensis TaxID=1329262 RepID=A0A3N1XL41_9FIRM|nr:glycoside hydrolase family 30 beta sandwich domain-containing protein [Mobilisporobacter senegalensis]ROR27430.1 glucosylceramidase [Mobilisporobacter senegalensis]
MKPKNIKLITTKYESSELKKEESITDFTMDNGIEMQAVNIYPQVEYQTFHGFGGAITEAAGYTYSKMNEEVKLDILESYFGKSGNNYNMARCHIDSCDFSLGCYEAMSDPEDTGMESFSLERDEEYIIPLLKEAEKKHGEPLSIMLSPWSPPSFMKTNNNKKGGGKLKEEYREFWAEYICRYIKEYQKRGFQIDRITIQNEPNATQTWDSCVYSEEEEKVFLRDFLYPSLVKNGLEDIKINIWDHNKERMFERAQAIIDEETDKMVSGIAFHWYSGDHFEAIGLVKEIYPGKELIFTEGCVEYSRFGGASQLENAQMYAHDIIGNINGGMTAFIDWNILLDEKGGPNHVGNYCDAPIMCNTITGEIQKNLSYTYIGHFSKYIKPGAKRIAFTKYTGNIEITAMKNEDGSIILVFLNCSNKDVNVALRLNGQVADLVIPGGITTGIIDFS